MRGSDLTTFQRGQIYALRKHAEWSYQRISDSLNLSLSAVSKYCQRNINDQQKRQNCKRQRVTTERFDRHIVQHACKHPFKGTRQIATDLSAVQLVSHFTINRRLNASGFLPFSPAVKPFLSAAHEVARLSWAQNHLQTNWSSVIFSDESKFQMAATKQQFVRRRKNTRLQRSFVIPLQNASSPNCMVWGSFCRDGYSDLVRLENRLNSEGYVEILERYFILSSTR